MAELGTALAERRDGAGGVQRAIRRRRGLPNGRALVGGFLVAASAVGVFAAFAAASAGPQDSYVVAARDLDAGQRLDPEDLGTVLLDLPEPLRGRSFTSPVELVGATVLAPRAAGELVHTSDVVRLAGAPGTRELSFSIDAGRALGDRLRGGEQVDVVATYGTGRDAYTVLVVAAARVIRARAAAGGLVGDGRVELTLEVADPGEMLALAHAVDVGQVTVVRSTGTPAAGAPGVYRPAAEPQP